MIQASLDAQHQTLLFLALAPILPYKPFLFLKTSGGVEEAHGMGEYYLSVKEQETVVNGNI